MRTCSLHECLVARHLQSERPREGESGMLFGVVITIVTTEFGPSLD